MKLNDKLHLNRIDVGGTRAAPKADSVAHIVIIDRSGSMHYDLPKIAEQIKFRLAAMIKPEDTVSLIAFSGRGQCVLVFQDEQIAALGDKARIDDLQRISTEVDKQLRPMGLTGFLEPLVMAGAVQDRIAKLRPGTVFSLFFMSDGHDNQWSRRDILEAAANMKFHAATVVEYGSYADRQMLNDIAAHLGGEFIIARDFAFYEPAFDNAMRRPVSGAPRHTITLNQPALHNVAFAIDDETEAILTYAPDADNNVTVPANISAVYYLSAEPDRKSALGELGNDALYAALSIFAVKMQPKVMFALLGKLADVYFITKYAACFGAEAYADYQEDAKKAVFDDTMRGLEGFDPNAVPKDNLFTLMDLFAQLERDPDTRLLLDDPRFKYKRIGRKTVDAAEVLTVTEKEKLNAAAKELQDSEDLDALNKLAELIKEIRRGKVKTQFVADPAPDGYKIRSIDYGGGDRANVNIGITRTGTVDLQDFDLQLAPYRFETVEHRTYTFMKDGKPNVELLPAHLGADTVERLREEMNAGRLSSVAVLRMDDGAYILQLNHFPILNHSQTEYASATDLIIGSFQKLQHEARRKVYKYFLDKHFPAAKQSTFIDLYGSEDAEILKQAGITPGGYSPKRAATESEDVYVAYKLEVKLKGYSSLPKVEDVISMVQDGTKPTAAKLLMAEAVQECLDWEKHDNITQAELLGCIAREDEKVKRLARVAAGVKLAVIVGKVWFTELDPTGDNTLTIDVDGTDVTGTIVQSAVEVKI